jgi:hypothetical protein
MLISKVGIRVPRREISPFAQEIVSIEGRGINRGLRADSVKHRLEWSPVFLIERLLILEGYVHEDVVANEVRLRQRKAR